MRRSRASLGSTFTAAFAAAVAFFVLPATGGKGNLLLAILISAVFVAVSTYLGDSIYNSWNNATRPVWKRAIFLFGIIIANFLIAWLASSLVMKVVI